MVMHVSFFENQKRCFFFHDDKIDLLLLFYDEKK